MSHTALSFEALAISNKVKYVVDHSSDTLIVDDINDVDLSEFVNLIKQYAYEKGIAKISVKVKEPSAIYFFQHGFKVEASIMAYYGLQDAFYVVYFLDQKRSNNPLDSFHESILEKAYANSTSNLIKSEVDHVSICSNEQQSSIDGKEQMIFTSRDHTHNDADKKQKFFAQIGNKIVATANAFHRKSDNVVEFSDFTVNVALDIRQLLNHLIKEMGAYYFSAGCNTAFTLVPASNLAINAICVENDFEFGGRLTNESVVEGQLDSLNTWFKRL